MSTAPLLTEADLRAEIERLFRHKHRNHLVALYGRGEPGGFEVEGATWEVVPTRCELDLRARLPDRADPELRRVYLVDWADDMLPLDVACRLAGGRIYHVARDARLAALFGARQVEPGLAGTALARYLLAGGATLPRKIPGFRLTRDEAFARFLEARLGIPEGAAADPARLLGWTRTNDAGPAFARQGTADENLRAVQHELRDWVRARLGPVALVVWRAWETGQVDRLLQVLLLLDAAGAVQDAYTRGLLGGQLGAWLPGISESGTLATDSPAVDLSTVLDARSEADRRLFAAAQALAGANLASVCAFSTWLPAGLAARESAFADAIERVLSDCSPDALRAARAAFEQLGAHRLYPGSSLDSDPRRMVARLAAWLVARRARPPVAPYGAAWQPAVELARIYAEEGGYRDWARQAVRGLRGATPRLEEAARKLLAVVDHEAREDDRRFAEAYVSWLDAGRPSAEVVPIEHVAKRVVAPFTRGATTRRLLLVLMDGMSQTAAVQLLHRLAAHRKWGPIAWRVPSWRGHLPLPPVLAAAPTLTQVSRAALFAGTADPRFGDEGTDRDEARWSANPHVREALGGAAPVVFFRRDVHAGHDLVAEVRAAIASDAPVVAVVVNAIDEQLSGSIQVGVDYSSSPVLPLEALLTAAEGDEPRAVLLVADHGHVPGDAMRTVAGRLDGSRPGGARWRALASGEEPASEEVRLPHTCWHPRGWDGVAVLWDAGLANRAPNHGEHGGLSLAETVAPAVLVGPEWLDRASADDSDLKAVPLPLPDWWELREPRTVATRAEPQPSSSNQLPLLGLPAPTPPAASGSTLPPRREPGLVRGLRASRIFRDHVRGVPESDLERILGWLAVLVEAGGALPAADFAAACGVRAHQVGGVVARMGVLNADGFAMVEHDIVGRRVVAHASRLTQQFGVSA